MGFLNANELCLKKSESQSHQKRQKNNKVVVPHADGHKLTIQLQKVREAINRKFSGFDSIEMIFFFILKSFVVF